MALALVSLGSQHTPARQNVVALSDREIVRRQEDLVVAGKLVAAAEKAAADKNYETAYVNYLDALDRIPAGAATDKQRAQIVAKFSDVAVLYAEQLITNGRYGDAERVAKTVLLPQYNPTYKPAARLLANLEQPDYYNKTVTPQFATDRTEVVKLLNEADGFTQAGRYDLALKRYGAGAQHRPL